jgi:hypothetical protein
VSTSDYIGLPDDAPSSTNKVRTFSVVDDTGTTVLEAVNVIADADGNLLGVTAEGRPRLLVRAEHLQEELGDIVKELREIKSVLVDSLRPEGSSSKEGL